MFTKNPCPVAAVVFVVMTDCHDVPPPPPPPAASVISVPLNVNTSLADAPDCNPGILKEVTLELPIVTSFETVALEG